MRVCLNPVCGLEILEDAVCGCGWDNSVAEEIAAVELAEESAELSMEARAVGGVAGAILREEAAELRAESRVEELEARESFWA